MTKLHGKNLGQSQYFMMPFIMNLRKEISHLKPVLQSKGRNGVNEIKINTVQCIYSIYRFWRLSVSF